MILRRSRKNARLAANLQRYLSLSSIEAAADRLAEVPTRKLPEVARATRARRQAEFDAWFQQRKTDASAAPDTTVADEESAPSAARDAALGPACSAARGFVRRRYIQSRDATGILRGGNPRVFHGVENRPARHRQDRARPAHSASGGKCRLGTGGGGVALGHC